jgi:ABC-type transport system involved in multi-copper enzyme maturation permease subunit
MPSSNQILHIFRKDIREFRIEIGTVLLLTLLIILTNVQSWESLQRHGSFGNSGDDNPFSVLLAITWCLLIARVIHAEALPGDRHFWLTRPYDRKTLVLSKLMFVAVFINLPLLVAQALIVSMDGLPLFANFAGLLWNQVLVSLIILLPAAAVAAVTRNLVQFIPAAVFIIGLLAIPFRTAEFDSSDEAWIRAAIGLTLAAAIVTVVIWRQYRFRRTLRTVSLALGATLAAIILVIAFPQSTAFAIQSKVIGAANSQFAMKLGEKTPPSNDRRTPNKYTQQLALPVAVAGSDPQNLRVQGTNIAFKTLSGVVNESWMKVDVTPEGVSNKTSIGRDFFNEAKDAPVTVQATYAVTEYGHARTVDVPLDGTPVYIPGLGQCGTVPNYNQRTFVCRSAFRSAADFSSEVIRKSAQHRRWFDTYSPFPARLTIVPVIRQIYQLNDVNKIAPSEPEPPAHIIIRDRVAYFHYTMELPNVHLADYAVPDRDDDSEQ